jgi:hypothetical protein
MSAGNWKRDEHPVPLLKIFHVRPGFGNHAHKLMTEHEGTRLGQESVVDVQIRTANRGRGNLQDNVFRMLNRRIRTILNTDVPGLVKNRGFHAEISQWGVALDVIYRFYGKILGYPYKITLP